MSARQNALASNAFDNLAAGADLPVRWMAQQQRETSKCADCAMKEGRRTMACRAAARAAIS
jgi:hypothetical protein